MNISGIVSLTMKQLTPGEVIALARKARLGGIEWSSNCHVPPEDTALAAAIGDATRGAGLKVVSYATYHKLGQGMDWKPLIAAAKALGAPNIRIWAGGKGSADASEEERRAWTEEAKVIADDCAAAGLTLSFEYHQGTLTDDADSAVRMMREIGRENAFLYWQPNQKHDLAWNVAALTKVVSYVSNIHTFAWVGSSRFPLADHLRDWNEYMRILKGAGRDRAFLLEFVPDDLPANVLRDGASLNAMLRDDTAFALQTGAYRIPYSRDTSVLAQPLEIGGKLRLRNRLTVHPMEGFDSTDDGGPGELTFRRYHRFAQGGAALIWLEATAVVPEGRSNAHQLWIHRENAAEFKRLRDAIRADAPDTPVILQLTHSGRFSAPTGMSAPVIAYHNPVLNERLNVPADLPVATDDYLDSLTARYVEAAEIARDCGFDGVDIKVCHRYLLSELCSAYTREGKHGGSFENRTRLIKEIFHAVNAAVGQDLAICSRFAVYDHIPYPWGFGWNREQPGVPDFTEPVALLKELMKEGLCLIDITMGTPYYNPYVNRPFALAYRPEFEHPLVGTERLLHYTGDIRAALPELAIIGTGYTYLSDEAQYAAAGAVADGLTDCAGFGRMAFAYPDFAKDILSGSFDKKKACITCGKCTMLMRAHTTTGCPVRDGEVYAPIFRAAYKPSDK